jgi:hypothetical protein
MSKDYLHTYQQLSDDYRILKDHFSVLESIPENLHSDKEKTHTFTPPDYLNSFQTLHDLEKGQAVLNKTFIDLGGYIKIHTNSCDSEHKALTDLLVGEQLFVHSVRSFLIDTQQCNNYSESNNLDTKTAINTSAPYYQDFKNIDMPLSCLGDNSDFYC